MKILWHMPTFRRATCGLSIRARRLATELRSRGYDTTFAVAGDKTDITESTIDGHAIRIIKVERREPLHWSIQAREKLRFARIAVRSVSDVPHDLFVTCQPEAVTAYRAISSTAPVAYVCGGTTILHDDSNARNENRRHTAFHRVAPAIDRRLKRQAERVAFANADLCIFDSESTRRRVIDAYSIDQAKCHALHGAVDCDRFSPPTADQRRTSRAALGLHDGEFVVAWTGRLSPEKNLPTLIRALYQCKTVRARLLIAGCGPDRSSLEAINGELIGDGNLVRFLGMREDIRPVLHAADAFIFPSVSESLGLSLVEAMSCGLPCVALAADERTIRNASTEILQSGECGILVERNDPFAIADAIDRLANDAGLRAILAERGRRRAVERYDWQRAGDAFDQLISTLFCRSNQLRLTQRAIHSTEPVRA